MRQINKERLANFTEDILLFLLHIAQTPIKAFLETSYKGCSPLLRKASYSHFNYLKRSGYLKQKGKCFGLTQKGKNEARYIIWRHKKIDKQTWDGKWRIFCFDVPEKRKKLREKLRFRLRNLNFVKLQDSVWVTPLPIEKEIDELLQILEIKYFVRFMIAETINFDQDLKKIFFESSKK